MMLLGVTCHQLQICLSVLLIEENRSAVVATLRYVMWVAGAMMRAILGMAAIVP